MKENLLSAALVGGVLTTLAVSDQAIGQVEKNLNQAQTDEIETVVILGNRQAYQGNFSSLETPQAELAIHLETLRNAGALGLSEALDLSASVARQNNFGGLWNSFAVRGFVGDENTPSNYLVNGFNAGRGFGGSRDLSGIETVEVLKGPRAAVYGRGEPGGTVNLVTKRPTFEKATELVFSAGSFDTYRSDVDWTSPLSENVAARFVGYVEEADSFRDTVESSKQGMSPSLAWKISDSSLLTYELEYSEQEVPFDRGVVAVDGELGRVPESRFLGEPGDGPMQAEVLGHQLELSQALNEQWSVFIGASSSATSLEGFATETNLTSLTSDDAVVGRFRRYRDYDATYNVFRAELDGNFNLGGVQHRLMLGIDSDKFENDQVFLRVRGGQEIHLYNPVYGAYPLPEPQANTDRLEVQRSSGILIQDQISLTEKLDIRIGARFDDYSQTLDNRRNSTKSELDDSRISPQFGAVYQVSDAVSLYASYGENFRPLSGTDASGNGFKPNQSVSTEAGVKYESPTGELTATVSVFKIKQDNILVVDDPTAFSMAAVGEAQSQGLEFDLNGELTEHLNVWVSYAYVDAQTSNEFFDANFGRTVEAGSPLVNVPEQQLSLQLVNSGTLMGRDLTLGGGFLHVGERNGYFGVDFNLPSYTTVQAFAAYQFSPALELRVNIENLLDEQYYPNSFADTWVQPGTPRNIRASAVVRF